MRRIYKYELEVTDVQQVDIPMGAIILSAQNQNGQVCVWALVDPTHPPLSRTFRIYGTGNPCDVTLGKSTFIDTVQTMGGRLVWHVFVDNAL